MIYKIANENYMVEVESVSAELSGLYSKKLERQFVWQKADEIFPNSAKNLFPNIGMVNKERIFVNGKEYPLIQHGFAKDMDFELVNSSQNTLEFSLKSNSYTKHFLPYDFIFTIKYVLDSESLTQYYIVKNVGNEDMYFAVGAHTGFYCPIALEESADDYYLDFGSKQTYLTELLRNNKNSLRTGKTRKIFLDKGKLQISDHTFDNGAFITSDHINKSVMLKSKKSGLFVKVDFPDFPYCTFWSRKGELYYVCIEPWCGLPDSEKTDHNFETKDGNNKLLPQEVFERKQIFTIGKTKI